MSRRREEHGSRSRGWSLAVGAYALFCVVVLALVWYRSSASSDATDFRDFWENAVHFRQTGRISFDLGVHNYLPFFTILMTPWSFLPLQLAATLFVALSLGLFALTVWMCGQLLGDPLPPREGAGGGSKRSMSGSFDFDGVDPPVVPPRRGDGPEADSPPSGPRASGGFTAPLPPGAGAGRGSTRETGRRPVPHLGLRPALLVAVALALPYVYACAVLGNLGLLLVFLIVACWYLVEHGQDTAAGAALALATLIKLMPAALIVFFLLKRRWRVAGVAAGVALALGVVMPVLSLGPRQAWADHVEFYQRAVRGHSAAETILAEHPIKANYSNNALPIVLRRLLSPVNGAKGDVPMCVNVADVPRPAILSLYAALMVALIGGSVMAALRGTPTWPPRDPDDLAALRWQFGLWCCLMLLASPLVWTHYLPLAFFPLALAADGLARARQGSRDARWLAAALLIWLLAAVLLVWPAARAAGAITLGVLALWAVSMRFAVRR